MLSEKLTYKKMGRIHALVRESQENVFTAYLLVLQILVTTYFLVIIDIY